MTTSSTSSRPAAAHDRTGRHFRSRRSVAEDLAARDLAHMVRGGATSAFGSALTGVTLAVVAVDRLHITGIGAGLLSSAAALPNLVFGLYAGAIADRVRRPRRILVLAEIGSATAVLATALALSIGWLDLAVLVAVQVAAGSLGCATQALFFTHLSGVVGQDGLGTARARMQSASYAANAGGSAVAGGLVRATTPVLALVADAASYLYSAVRLHRIRTPDRNPALAPDRAPTGSRVRAATIHRDVADGLRMLAGSPILPVIGYAVVAQLAFGATMALRSIFLLRTLAVPVAFFGLPGLSAALLGSLGSMLAVRLVRRGVDSARLAAGCWATGAVTVFALPLAGGPAALSLGLATAGIAVPVMCGAAANVGIVGVIGRHVPTAHLGRVNAVFLVTVSFATIAGSLVAGRAADVFGVRATLWGSAFVGLAGLVLLVPMLRRLAAAGAGEPR